MKLFRRSLIALALAAPLATAFAQAQNFPNKPIRLVVPFGPGGGADVAARIVGIELGNILGQPIVVDNKAGAGTIVGTQFVAKAEPDGYTLLWTTDIQAINEAMNRLGRLQSKLQYDLKDFDAVGQALNLQIALMASKKSGITSMQDLAAKAKAANGGMSAGSNGEGSPHYLAFLNMQHMGGYKLIDVPYSGSGPTAVAVQAGDVDLAFGTVGSAAQIDKNNRATILAVSGPTRDPVAPNIPTIAESGYPGFSILSWMGIVAPKGVPADRLNTLNAALNKVLAMPDVAQKLKAAGMYAAPKPREQFAELIVKDSEKIETIYRNAKK